MSKLQKKPSALKRDIQHLKTWNFLIFTTFMGHFWPPGSGSAELIESGSVTLVSTLLLGLPVWSWRRGPSRVGWAWTWGPCSPGVTHPRSPPPLAHGSSARYLVGWEGEFDFSSSTETVFRIQTRMVILYHCSGYRTFWALVGFRKKSFRFRIQTRNRHS